MSFLFKIQDKVVFPNPETLLISPFKEIWERDTDPDKHQAIKELTYVEFITSMLKSNPYREYQDDRKDIVLRQDIIKDDTWQPDELIEQAIEKIKEFQTEGSLTYNYWIANKNVLEKQIEFFNTVDIGERNFKTGNPIYKPKDIPDAVSTAEKVLTTINALKSKVDEELFESTKTRGEKVISPFADPSSLRKK